MKALDTNILIRYLVEDDKGQARRARRYIERAVDSGESLLVNLVVLCELVWVLESAYKLESAQVVEILDLMLRTAEFEIESRDVVTSAVADYSRSQADLADCIIGRQNQALGCDETATFDKRLANTSGFSLI